MRSNILSVRLHTNRSALDSALLPVLRRGYVVRTESDKATAKGDGSGSRKGIFSFADINRVSLVPRRDDPTEVCVLALSGSQCSPDLCLQPLQPAAASST